MARSVKAFSLVEVLAASAVLAVLLALATPYVMRALQAASTAIAAHTLRQLAVASQGYLMENGQRFWKYSVESPDGVEWWFGYETSESRYGLPEGSRALDLTRGPLGPYIGSAPGRRPDPTFLAAGRTFKPKFKNCYFPYGYNRVLEGKHAMAIEKPGAVVVFATSAQVNTFQRPASATRPMLEEFYFIDAVERTVHFRINGKAMVVFANWSAGFLEMDPTTLDKRMPGANVGRFAPKDNTLYLK